MSFDSALDGVKTQIRKPYEELQSINEDGFIVAMKYSTSANSMMEKDYLYFLVELVTIIGQGY